jgi:hypothetical protein
VPFFGSVDDVLGRSVHNLENVHAPHRLTRLAWPTVLIACPRLSCCRSKRAASFPSLKLRRMRSLSPSLKRLSSKQLRQRYYFIMLHGLTLNDILPPFWWIRRTRIERQSLIEKIEQQNLGYIIHYWLDSYWKILSDYANFISTIYILGVAGKTHDRPIKENLATSWPPNSRFGIFPSKKGHIKWRHAKVSSCFFLIIYDFFKHEMTRRETPMTGQVEGICIDLGLQDVVQCCYDLI